MNTRIFPLHVLCQAACLTLLSTAAPAQDKNPKAKNSTPAEKKESKESAESKPAAKPRDEATAIAEFKGDMKAIKEWMKTQKGQAATPATGVRVTVEMVSRMSKVRTDGLPKDLETLFGEINVLLGKMGSMFDGAPKEDAEVQQWMTEKLSNPEFVKQFRTVAAEVEKKNTQLIELGAKYGIKDELNFDDKKSGGQEEAGKTDKKEGGAEKDK